MKPKHRRRLVCTFLFAAIVIGMAAKEQAQPRSLCSNSVECPNGFVAFYRTMKHDFTPEELARLPGTRATIELEIRNAVGPSKRKTKGENLLILAVDRVNREGEWYTNFTFAIKENERRHLIDASDMGPLQIRRSGLWHDFRDAIREIVSK